MARLAALRRFNHFLLASLCFVLQSNFMKTNWAEENLQTIRTLMERSAVYRRALAPIMIFCGILGALAGLAGWQLEILSLRGFAVFWSSTATVALACAFFLARRQAINDSEPFWSPPTRRVAQALMPPFLVGLILSVFCIIFGKEDYEPLNQLNLMVGWSWSFGCAIYSAGFFMPRGTKWFGLLFVIVGMVLLGYLADLIPFGRPSLHLLMGIIFGGLHLIYGIYLYFTEKRKNAA
jgi:hypothetical protein